MARDLKRNDVNYNYAAHRDNNVTGLREAELNLMMTEAVVLPTVQ